MYSYMVGKIISINKKTITFENNYIGYVIFVSDPQNFVVGKVIKLYLYKHLANGNKNNINEELYGFGNYNQKELFLQLINISGIGPKTALMMCDNDINIVRSLISKKDIETLISLNGFTPKLARIVIDNLYDSNVNETINNSIELSQLVQALKSLGYSQKDIDLAIHQIDFNNKNIELSDLISQSIKVIATQQNNG